jgi:hypothetical protein
VIVLNPLVAVGADRALYFSTRLAAALQAKGEGVFQTQLSGLNTNPIELKKKLVRLRPDVIINVKCESDLDPNIRGFFIECNKYTALVGTMAFVFDRNGFEPSILTGYMVTGASTSARLCEITINLGFISNLADSALLENTVLDNLIKDIVAFSYAPPTKPLYVDEDVILPDSYFTKGLWTEVGDSKTVGDTGVIEDIQVSHVPLRALRLTRATTGVLPYQWKIDFTNTLVGHPHKCLFSVRNITTDLTVDASIQVDVAGVSESYTLTSREWAQFEFELVPSTTADSISFGVLNACEVQVASVWIVPSGAFDELDDPAKRYSIFPPQYRPTKTIELPTSPTDIIREVATEASSLIGRAADAKASNIGSELQGLTGQLDFIKLNPKSFIDSTGPFMRSMSNESLTQIPVIDPSKVDIKYETIEKMIPEINRSDKQIALQKAVNSMKNLERAVEHHLSSGDMSSLEGKAQEYAVAVKDRFKKIGQNVEVE